MFSQGRSGSTLAKDARPSLFLLRQGGLAVVSTSALARLAQRLRELRIER